MYTFASQLSARNGSTKRNYQRNWVYMCCMAMEREWVKKSKHETLNEFTCAMMGRRTRELKNVARYLVLPFSRLCMYSYGDRAIDVTCAYFIVPLAGVCMCLSEFGCEENRQTKARIRSSVHELTRLSWRCARERISWKSMCRWVERILKIPCMRCVDVGR